MRIFFRDLFLPVLQEAYGYHTETGVTSSLVLSYYLTLDEWQRPLVRLFKCFAHLLHPLKPTRRKALLCALRRVSCMAVLYVGIISLIQ